MNQSTLHCISLTFLFITGAFLNLSGQCPEAQNYLNKVQEIGKLPAKEQLTHPCKQAYTHIATWHTYKCECDNNPRTAEQAENLKNQLNGYKSTIASFGDCGSVPYVNSCKVQGSQGGSTGGLGAAGSTGGMTAKQQATTEIIKTGVQIVGVLAQAAAAKRARKEEEARLEMIRLDNLAREGIGDYDSNGEKHGEWWYGYAHENLKSKGAYDHGTKNGMWMYAESDKDDLNLVWYKDGIQGKDLQVYYYNQDDQFGWRSSDGKQWLLASAFYTKRSGRGWTMMKGSYEDGKRKGEFEFRHDNGATAQLANYDDGLLYGSISGWRPGTTSKRDLRIFDGNMENNLKHGSWQLYHGNKEKVASEGLFEKDKREGVWNYYSPNGAITSTVSFADDLKNGDTYVYHKDGSIRGHRQYTNDIPNGVWTSYYDGSGSSKTASKSKDKKSIGHIAARVLVPSILLVDAASKKGPKKKKGNKNSTVVASVGETTENLANQSAEITAESDIHVTVEFIEGELNGPYLKYYSNGSLEEQGMFSAGIPVGEWQYFDEEENLIAKGLYASGKEIAEDFFYNVNPKDFSDKWTSLFRGNSLAKKLPIEESIYKYRYDTDHDIASLSEGIRTGEWIIYYPSGQVKEIINYDEKGQKHGSFESFYDNGNPKAIGEYYFDKKVGDWQNFKSNGDAKESLLGKKEGKKNAALDLFKKKKK